MLGVAVSFGEFFVVVATMDIAVFNEHFCPSELGETGTVCDEAVVARQRCLGKGARVRIIFRSRPLRCCARFLTMCQVWEAQRRDWRMQAEKIRSL